MSKKFVAAGVMAASLMAAGAASAAPTEITMWHAMANTLGDWVADVTKDFNAKTPQCHLTSTYKGTYDQTMTSASRPPAQDAPRTFFRCLKSARQP